MDLYVSARLRNDECSDTPSLRHEAADEIDRLQEAKRRALAIADERAKENAALRAALTESVKLQSHYAGLLNNYDGGRRMKFADADAWVARLRALEQGARE